MQSNQGWHNAIEELDTLMEKNQDFVSGLRQIDSREQNVGNAQSVNYHMRQENFSNDDKPGTAEMSHFLDKKIGAIDIEAALKDLVILGFIDDRVHSISALQKFESELLDHSKGFAEVVKDGPENNAEAALLDSAIKFLAPHEIEAAVRNNLPVSAVLAQIQNSQIMQATLPLIREYQEAFQEKQEELATELASIGNVLGKEFGVLSSIQETLAETNINDIQVATTTPHVQRDNERGGLDR